MTLSDHLDMVGVTLKATWSQTKKANGDVLQKKVQNMVGPWKSGKVMAITQRGWSLNIYALSKVWFRTKCVDLRVCDIKKITSLCKSWLYQDMFAKPEEFILHRPHHYGGLGLHSVKYKVWQALSQHSSKLPQIHHSIRISFTISSIENMCYMRKSQRHPLPLPPTFLRNYSTL